MMIVKAPFDKWNQIADDLTEFTLQTSRNPTRGILMSPPSQLQRRYLVVAEPDTKRTPRFFKCGRRVARANAHIYGFYIPKRY